MEIEPIGTFRCAEQYPYDAARQGTAAQDNTGRVVLREEQNFEQALQDLDAFSHIWLIFQFHHNTDWKPVVQPPRGPRKVGVFASRAPYRPNAIGLSCVRLLKIAGRTLHVADHDLLDGTPILDIKPYIPYADAVPEASSGWLAEVEGPGWDVSFTAETRDRVQWLESNGVACLEAFLKQQLAHDPFNRKRKRVKHIAEEEWEIAYRTWRAHFTADRKNGRLCVDGIGSGYSDADLADGADPHEDKELHRAFVARFEAEKREPRIDSNSHQ